MSSLETSLAASAIPADSSATSDEGFEHYRALSGSAVVSLILGIVSVVSLLDFWILKVVPILGIVAGLGALRTIRRQPDELSGRNVALAGVGVSAFLLFAGSAWSGYSYAVEVPEGYQRIDYTMLKHPEESRKNSVSPAAQALEGKKVFLKGFMFPTAHDKGLTRFVLCRDNGDCCFGGQPPPSDMVFIQLKTPLQATFTTKIRHVAGIFHVAGSHSSDVNKDVLYQLEADYIK
ncbi:MAG: DUF4190 domain-containing protein [Planctomycetia bacterium]|nr:DUF4190 domain-containing protein [Planctomycetia bacterium]